MISFIKFAVVLTLAFYLGSFVINIVLVGIMFLISGVAWVYQKVVEFFRSDDLESDTYEPR